VSDFVACSGCGKRLSVSSELAGHVSPRKALRLAVDMSGHPVTSLFTNWPAVERFLTDRILTIVRQNYVLHQEHLAVSQAITRQMGEQAKRQR